MVSINFRDGFQSEEKTRTLSNSWEICFHQPEWRISWKNTFLLDGKKLTGVSKNGEKKWFSLAAKPVASTTDKLPLVLIPRNFHCLEKFLVVLVLNYENGEKWNKSLFVYIGSCRESIREFQTAANFSNTIC